MERVIRFGRDRHLAGVLQPSSNAAVNTGLAVIIPNAGFVPHPGPFRLHVDLARQLTKLGVASLRFDLSGLGDSVVPSQREPLQQRKNADLVDAIELMRSQLGPSCRIVLLGLCSGATDSHRAALVDERVQGIVMLDPVAYPDRLYRIRALAEKILDPMRISRFVGRRLSRLLRGPRAIPLTDPATTPATAGQPAAPQIHKPTPVTQFANELERNTRRGLKYLFVYSGARNYNHRKQLLSILTKATPRDRVSVQYFARFDHTLVLRGDRQVVLSCVCEWLTTEFGSKDQRLTE